MTKNWIITRNTQNGINEVVCGNKIAFAKIGLSHLNRCKEKLASKLSRIVDVNAVLNEDGDVFTNIDNLLVPVKSKTIVSHTPEGKIVDINCNSEVVRAALRKASGLLTFLAWINSPDHVKTDNFVATELENGEIKISAFDFCDAFYAITNQSRDPQFDYCIYCPEEFKNHIDCQSAMSIASKIEKLKYDQIKSCCISSGMDECCAELFTKELINRAADFRKKIIKSWQMKKIIKDSI